MADPQPQYNLSGNYDDTYRPQNDDTGRHFYDTNVIRCTTRKEVEDLLAEHSVIQYSDHNRDGGTDNEVTDKSIVYGSNLVMMYLESQYEIQDLILNPLVRRWATIIAAWDLSQVRGASPPQSLQDRYLELVGIGAQDGLLDKIHHGYRPIPGIPKKPGGYPVMVNRKVDRRAGTRKIRVKRSTSTPTESKIRRDYYSPWTQYPSGGYPR